MKRIRSFSLILLLSAGAAFGQIEKYGGMKGTEDPVFSSSSDTGRCFVFSKYVVKTTQAEVGEDVAAYKRKGSAQGIEACETKGQPVLEVKDSDNNSFSGLWGTYLFIGMGTSAESADMAVYSLSSHETLVTLSYSGEPRFTEARFVSFDEPSEKKGPIKTCRDAAKWKRQGGGVGWVQGKKFDLQTLKATVVGTLRCVYVE